MNNACGAMTKNSRFRPNEFVEIWRQKPSEFKLKDGKRFRLGTDEPEALIRAVTVNTGQTTHG